MNFSWLSPKVQPSTKDARSHLFRTPLVAGGSSLCGLWKLDDAWLSGRSSAACLHCLTKAEGIASDEKLKRSDPSTRGHTGTVRGVLSLLLILIPSPLLFGV